MGPEKMFGLAETLPVWKVMFIQDKYIHSTQEKTRKKEGKRERKKERKKTQLMDPPFSRRMNGREKERET